MGKLASKYYWNPNWETDRKDVEENLLPPLYENIQSFIKKDNQGPWVLGQTLSVADFMLWCFLDLMRPFVPGQLPKYQELAKFHKDFSTREKIAEYLHSDKRYKNH